MYVDPNGHFSVAGTLLFVLGVGQAVLLVGGVVLIGGLAKEDTMIKTESQM